MISAATGGTLKVIGSSIAMVASGPMPGQHADQRADQHADEAVEQVLQRERDAEAEDQVVEQVHGVRSPASSGYGRPRPQMNSATDRRGQHDRQQHDLDAA